MKIKVKKVDDRAVPNVVQVVLVAQVNKSE